MTAQPADVASTEENWRQFDSESPTPFLPRPLRSRPVNAASHDFNLAHAGVAAEELKQFIERVERLQEERAAIADDIRDVYAEAKGRGFLVPALKAVIRARAMEPHEREELEAIVALYAPHSGCEEQQ